MIVTGQRVGLENKLMKGRCTTTGLMSGVESLDVLCAEHLYVQKPLLTSMDLLLSAFLNSFSPANINNLYVKQKSLFLQWKK